MPQQRRGEDLRRHILTKAKDVFLKAGYERTSMDAVAASAGTSKRSLYAHFENKEMLFLAVLDLVRELYLEQLKSPDFYAESPVEAVTRFCGRFEQLITWEAQVRTCRLVISEAEHVHGSAARYFETIVIEATARLADYLRARFELDLDEGSDLAQTLLEETALPRLFRALLNVEGMISGKRPPSRSALAADVDLDGIRSRIAAHGLT